MPDPGRSQRLLNYHVAKVMEGLAKADEILAGPWSRGCPDCGAPPRRPCYPECLRFADDTGGGDADN